MIKPIAFVFVACSLWVLINLANLQQFLEAYNNRNRELEQIGILKEKISQLERKRISLQSTGIESEREAREHLTMHLPGEELIILERDEEATTQAGATVLGQDLPPALPPEPPAEKLKKSEKARKKSENPSRLKKVAGRQ